MPHKRKKTRNLTDIYRGYVVKINERQKLVGIYKRGRKTPEATASSVPLAMRIIDAMHGD
jgi:hypothetical protein